MPSACNFAGAPLKGIDHGPRHRRQQQVDRALPILNISPLRELLDRTLTQERLIAPADPLTRGIASVVAELAGQ